MSGKDPDMYLVTLAHVDFMQLRAIVYSSHGLTEMPKSFIRAITEDSFVPQEGSNKATQGRNFLFEHFIAAKFRGAGCVAVPDEPDWKCEYYPIKFNIAAKRSALKRLEDNIKSARRQILMQDQVGIIALDVTKNNLSPENEFQGSIDEYRKHLHKWLDEKVMAPIRRNYKSWGVKRSQIPAIIISHFGVGYDPYKLQWYTVPHFTLFRVDSDEPFTRIEMLHRPYLEQLFKALHRSAPENGRNLGRNTFRYNSHYSSIKYEIFYVVREQVN
jgi:hypothetical protein